MSQNDLAAARGHTRPTRQVGCHQPTVIGRRCALCNRVRQIQGKRQWRLSTDLHADLLAGLGLVGTCWRGVGRVAIERFDDNRVDSQRPTDRRGRNREPGVECLLA